MKQSALDNLREVDDELDDDRFDNDQMDMIEDMNAN